MYKPDPVGVIAAQVVAAGLVGTIFQAIFPVHTELEFLERIENVCVGFAIGYVLTYISKGK